MEFFGAYFRWHYGKAIPEFFALWKNFLWHWYHHFSLPLLFKTLLAPFRRVQTSYRESVELGALFENFFFNTFMRLIGLCMRLVVIGAGALALALTLAAAPVALALWLAAPLIVWGLLFLGVFLVIF